MGGGWWTLRPPEGLADAITDVLTMPDPKRRFFKRNRRSSIGLLMTAALCVQCHHLSRRVEPQADAVRAERVYAAAVVTGVTDEYEQLAGSDPLAFLHRCREHYGRNYRDYTCLFAKQERIGNMMIVAAFNDQDVNGIFHQSSIVRRPARFKP